MKALCTLRIIGPRVNVEGVADVMKPNYSFRVDKAGQNGAALDCVYFDVAEGETAVQLTEAMVAFLTRNEVALSKLVLGEEIIERTWISA